MTAQQVVLSASLAKIIDANRFEALVHQHRLGPCVSCNVRDHLPSLLPQQLIEQLNHTYQQNIEQSRRQFKTFSELLCLFKSADVPVHPIKGIPLAQRLYGDIAKRHARDIDLVIPPNKMEVAHELLTQNGYKCTCPEFGRLSRHQKSLYWGCHKDIIYVNKAGVMLELHTRLSGYSTSLSNKMSPQLFTKITVQEKLNNELLYLCWHGAHTLFHRMKWLLDISLYLEQNFTHFNEDVDELTRLANHYDVMKELTVSWLLANALFGVELPSKIDLFYQKSLISQIQAKQSLRALNHPQRQDSMIFKWKIYIFEVLMPCHWPNKWSVLIHRFKPCIIDLKNFPHIPKSLSILYFLLRLLRLFYHYKAGPGKQIEPSKKIKRSV